MRNRLLARELREELRPARLLLALTGGLVVGLVVVIVSISFGALIFSGELADFTSQGIGFGLLTAAVLGALVALGSSFRGMVATPQDSPAAIMALIAASIAASLPASAGREEVFATVVVAVSLTSIATGVFFFALGSFKLGGLVRFIPYPVIGGFLAGTALGSPPDEDYLLILPCVNELPRLAAGGLVFVSGPLAQGVDAPVDIGVIGAVVVDQGVDYRLRFLAS